MGKYAKNYLPIMFNIYTTDESTLADAESSSVRQAIFDSIKCYLKIADVALVNQYLVQALRNYENYSKISQDKQKELAKTNATALLTNKNDKKEATTESKAIKSKAGGVMFDFSRTSDAKSSGDAFADKTVDTCKNAEYSFLDLISLLVRYSNESNVKIVYELATNGIQVSEI
jgi:hypothetical protein